MIRLSAGQSTFEIRLITYWGATTYLHDREMRLIALAVFFGGIAAFALVAVLFRRKKTPNEVQMDERDVLVLSRVPAFQLASVLIVTAIWAVILTEVYWTRGELPIVYPDLMFWSAMIVSLLTHSIGVILGYRRKINRA